MRKKVYKLTKIITKLLVYWLIFFFLITAIWIRKNFGEPSFEQIIYHFQLGVGILVGVDPAIAKSFIKTCLVYPAIFSFFMAVYEKLIFIDLTKRIIKVFLSIIYKMSFYFFRKKIYIILFIASGIFFLLRIAFLDYLKNLKESSFIGDNYVYPKKIVVPKNKKNLILIYVESLENTYSNKKIFSKDLLATLNTKTEKYVSFSEYKQTVGTNWTIAAIVSSQCGIPLLTTGIDGNIFGEKIKSFLPNAICLGDVLKDAGYKNIFMNGGSLSFAGDGKFLKQHGYSELMGREEWQAAGYDALGGWGLHDDLLLIRALEKIDALEKSGEPYNITILTVDTHGPNGFINKTCRNNGVSDFRGIVECTSGLLADFLDQIYKKGYMKNTNIVILGDHLAMGNDLSEECALELNKTIYNKFISSDSLKKNRESIHHFSIFPTILYSLGFRFDKNMLGLGASGFGKLDPTFKIDKMNDSELNNELSRFSIKYLEFWNNQNKGIIKKAMNILH